MFQLVQRPDVLNDLLKVSCTLYISVYQCIVYTVYNVYIPSLYNAYQCIHWEIVAC